MYISPVLIACNGMFPLLVNLVFLLHVLAENHLNRIFKEPINSNSYQFPNVPMKGNHECSNMGEIILSADPPLPWGLGQKVRIKLFQNMVKLHIKNGITNAATQ